MGSGLALLPGDLVLTNYTCNNPLSTHAHILRSWGLGHESMFGRTQSNPWQRIGKICIFSKIHQWFSMRNTTLTYPLTEQMGKWGPEKPSSGTHRDSVMVSKQEARYHESSNILPNVPDCLLAFRPGDVLTGPQRPDLTRHFQLPMSAPGGHLLLQRYLMGHQGIVWSQHLSPSQRLRLYSQAVHRCSHGHTFHFPPVVPLFIQTPVVTAGT